MQKTNLLIKSIALFFVIEIILISILLIIFSILSENCSDIEFGSKNLFFSLFFEISSDTGYHIDFSKYTIGILLFLGLIPTSIYFYKNKRKGIN